MKHILILTLSLITFFGHSQTLVDPTLSPTTARINAALSDAVAASGTDTYTGTKSGLTNVTDRAYSVKFPNTNTTSATFNLNGAGAVTIRKYESGSLVNLVAGDITGGQTYRLRYNGTYLVIEGGSGSGGGGITDLTGDVTASGTGSVVATIASGVIVDADVNASAAIAGTKLANTAAGGISATTVQAAINELDTEKQAAITFGVGVESALASSSGASSVVLRDANQNIVANNATLGYATTATAAGTTTLTVSSARDQYFTGSTTQTVVLPVVSTLTFGHTFLIVNNSSGIVTVQTSGSNVIQAMAPNSTLREECILTSGTGTASWSSLYTVSNPMTTWGDIVYGGDPGAGGVAPFTRLGPGTAGYFLQSNGSGAALSWAAPGGLSGLTATRIPVATSATTVADYNGLKWDDTGRLLTVGYASGGNNILYLGTLASGLNMNTSTGELRMAAAASHFPTFYSNNGEAMRINGTTRNVLIGTTTDNSKLTVNGSFAAAYSAKTANYTLDATNFLVNCTSNSFTITLPTAVSIAGRIYIIKNTGAGTITLATTSS